MNNSPTVQSLLDKICLELLTAPDFAQKLSLFDKLLHLINGAASLTIYLAVFIEKEQIKTDSLKAARIFGKMHDNVIRAIENLKCECDPDFYLLNFEEVIVKYQNGRGGIKEAPAYSLTEDVLISR